MKKTVPIFNYGPSKQLARRIDGVWFQRRKRDGKPGWNAWEPAPFTDRPAGCWFDGQFADLPK